MQYNQGIQFNTKYSYKDQQVKDMEMHEPAAAAKGQRKAGKVSHRNDPKSINVDQLHKEVVTN